MIWNSLISDEKPEDESSGGEAGAGADEAQEAEEQEQAPEQTSVVPTAQTGEGGEDGDSQDLPPPPLPQVGLKHPVDITNISKGKDHEAKQHWGEIRETEQKKMARFGAEATSNAQHRAAVDAKERQAGTVKRVNARQSQTKAQSPSRSRA